MLAWSLAQQILVLFLMMGCGFLLVKRNILTSGDSKVLSLITLYLALPAVIINAFQIDYSVEIRNGLLLAFGTAILIHALLFLLVWLIQKRVPLDPVEKASLVYSSAGNLIIPLVVGLLGTEWVIYTSAFLCVQTVLVWTVGQAQMRENSNIPWRKVFCNINLIASFLGILLFFSGIKLPSLITNTIDSLASTIGPLSMIMIGMLLADVNWKQIFSGKRIYEIVLLKMIVLPFIILLFLKYSRLSSLVPAGETVLLISLLAVITPSASAVTQLAQINNRDAVYAGTINALTTLVCIVTMPVMVLLYTM